MLFSFNPLLLGALGLLITFVILYVIVPLKKIYTYKRQGTEINFFPLVGMFQHWQKNFQQTGDAMAAAKESSKKSSNSKFMLTNFMKKPLIVLRDPQYAKEFLLKPQLYKKSDAFEILRSMAGDGLVMSEGDIWKRHRKLISNSFHYEFLKANTGVFQNTAKEFLDKLTPNDYVNYSAISKIQEITGEIVGRIFFGENLNMYTFEGKPLTLALADLTTELFDLLKTPLVGFFGAKALKIPFIPRYRKTMSRCMAFREICFKIISDRKNHIEEGQKSDDLLTSLLATQKSDDPEKRFSDKEIIDEFITFFVAGMDTTGHLIGMALYVLTQYPEYLQQLKEERERTYNKEATVTADTLQKMDVLHSFLKETLRFYTPAPLTFFREAIVDHKVCDIDVKKGDLITSEFFAPAFDRKYFDEPEKFSPERWRDSTAKIDPYAFTPFSAGPRNCIGQHLAMMEAKVIVSEFLERFDFKLKDGYKLEMLMRFLYEPDGELLFNLYPKVSTL